MPLRNRKLITSLVSLAITGCATVDKTAIRQEWTDINERKTSFVKGSPKYAGPITFSFDSEQSCYDNDGNSMPNSTCKNIKSEWLSLESSLTEYRQLKSENPNCNNRVVDPHDPYETEIDRECLAHNQKISSQLVKLESQYQNTSADLKKNLSSALQALRSYIDLDRRRYRQSISEIQSALPEKEAMIKKGKLAQKKIDAYGLLAEKKYGLTGTQLSMDLIRGDGVAGIGFDFKTILYLLEHSQFLEAVSHSSYKNKQGKHIVLNAKSTVTSQPITIKFIVQKKYVVLNSVSNNKEESFGGDALMAIIPLIGEQE